jgi:hypothetical protein
VEWYEKIFTSVDKIDFSERECQEERAFIEIIVGKNRFVGDIRMKKGNERSLFRSIIRSEPEIFSPAHFN